MCVCGGGHCVCGGGGSCVCGHVHVCVHLYMCCMKLHIESETTYYGEKKPL